jgi:serine/threonine-protein kinase
MSDAHTPKMTGGQPNSDFVDDFEIDLEPSQQFARRPAAPMSVTQSFHMALATHSVPSLNSETGELLRTRLRAATLFMFIGHAVFLLFGSFNQTSIAGLMSGWIAVRLVLCGLVLGLLIARPTLSHFQLRLLEYGFFGSLVILMMLAQYSVGSELIERGDLARLVALEKNGILNLLMLMVLYGIFIPNEPRDTARVVLTMALGPFVTLLALKIRAAESSTIMDQLASNEFSMSNLLYVVTSAALVIYISHVMSNLRRDLHQARKLGQYQLGEKLGEGGMGEVYLAEHQLLKRPCALKMIKPDVNTNPIALARFEREVQSAAMLSHPNTIEIFDYGHTDDGTFYYVMEYLPGLSISDLVREYGQMPPGRIVYLIRQVCGALLEAHRLGLVHRDLKPANILVAILGGKCDVAKVLDFGLVKLSPESGAVQLTSDYTVSGTPQYMSPEQATASADVDGRADIYSLGGILYFMLTGRPPFEGSNPTELMISHARDAVVPPSKIRHDVPADLEAVVLRCLAKKASDRYEDAKALGLALAACQCAGDWNDEKAEAWWIDQAGVATEPAAGEPAVPFSAPFPN